MTAVVANAQQSHRQMTTETPVVCNNSVSTRPTEDAVIGPAIFGLVLTFQAAHGHRIHFMHVVMPRCE